MRSLRSRRPKFGYEPVTSAGLTRSSTRRSGRQLQRDSMGQEPSAKKTDLIISTLPELLKLDARIPKWDTQCLRTRPSDLPSHRPAGPEETRWTTRELLPRLRSLVRLRDTTRVGNLCHLPRLLVRPSSEAARWLEKYFSGGDYRAGVASEECVQETTARSEDSSFVRRPNQTP